MKLYIVRHADAVSVGGDIHSDFDRTLTDRGRSDAVMMARMLAHLDIDIQAVLTSPLVRAVETGEIFGRELKREAATTQNLEPGFSPRSLYEEVASMPGKAGIVLIGHQPDVSMFISYLVSPNQGATIAMETAAIACVHLQLTGEGQLRWLLTPDVVKMLNYTI